MEQLLEMTATHRTQILAELRFCAIGYQQNVRWTMGLLDDCREEWEQAKAFAEANPSVKQTTAFGWYMQCLMRSTVNSGDARLAREVEREARAIMESEPADSPLRRAILEEVVPFFSAELRNCGGTAGQICRLGDA